MQFTYFKISPLCGFHKCGFYDLLQRLRGYAASKPQRGDIFVEYV